MFPIPVNVSDRGLEIAIYINNYSRHNYQQREPARKAKVPMLIVQKRRETDREINQLIQTSLANWLAEAKTRSLISKKEGCA